MKSFVRSHRCLVLGSLLLVWVPEGLRGKDADEKYPLGPQLKVLAGDVINPGYRKLVLEKMLITDLAAEWQRVATADNAESFLKEHGGRDKVLADPGLKRAFERRLKIRDDFLDLMRQGYKRYKQAPPFDRGAKAEPAGTEIRKPRASSLNLSAVLPAAGAERQWPRFRGPGGQGETDQKNLPKTWDKNGRNILWRSKVPGRGNSSPIVWGQHLFLTSANDKGDERFLLCFQLADGKLMWSRRAPEKPAEPQVRDKNGYASSTPVTDGERVIAFLGSCGLVCFDFEGNLLWHHGDVRIRTTHGTGSSPLLYKNLVILVQDQNQAESIFLALDKRTGKRVWQGKRGPAMTWSTPVAVRVGDHDELLFAGAETVRGYDPASGKELWSLRGPTTEVIPALVIGKDMIFSASGRNGPIVAFRPGGSGDVTTTHLVWRTVRAGPHVPSPALVKGRLYVANDTGVVTCLDAAGGKLIYQARLNDRFSASPVTAGELIYLCAESGVTYVVRASDQLEIVAENDLGSAILASPAVVNGQILLRTEHELVCVGLRSDSTRSAPE
jgi:outer membrane protein assembly factor BamB